MDQTCPRARGTTSGSGTTFAIGDPEDTSDRRKEEVYRLAGTLMGKMGKMHEIHPWRLSPDRAAKSSRRDVRESREGSTNRRKADEVEFEGKT